jgi:hypothetical protein
MLNLKGVIYMTKEQFIKCMQLIQNFHSEQETLAALISKICDAHPVVTIGDYLIDEMINIINKSLHIENDDLLWWWLYENVDKVMYDGDKEISVRTLEELYGYIVSVNKKE